MKKLFVLMLVLGLATAANAFVEGSITLQVSPASGGSYTNPVDSELSLNPSDTLWIGVHNSVAGIPGSAFSQMGQLTLGIQVPILGYDKNEDPIFGTSTASWTGQWVQFKPPLVAGAADNVYMGLGDMGGGVGIDWWYLNLSELSMTAANGIGILDAKELHCDRGGDTHVLLIDATEGTILDTIIIHQTGVPEPITIALLGLGGLFLRRRKK